jgi:short subunit fatty acids transporter
MYLVGLWRLYGFAMQNYIIIVEEKRVLGKITANNRVKLCMLFKVAPFI